MPEPFTMTSVQAFVNTKQLCPDDTGLTHPAIYETVRSIFPARLYLFIISLCSDMCVLPRREKTEQTTAQMCVIFWLVTVFVCSRMQDGSWNQPLPFSLLLKDLGGGRTLEGDGGVYSEASSDGEVYVDSVPELDSGDGDFADLTAFLSADEINRSLDLAWEAFDDQAEGEDPGPSNPTPQEQVLQNVPPLQVPPKAAENLNTSPNLQHQTKPSCPDENAAAETSSSQNVTLNKPVQAFSESEKVVRHKPVQPVYKQDKPRLLHEGLELNDRSASATEFCSRAATFIEELSSIFKGSPHLEQQVEEDSSSPDSGYLSPRSRRPAPQGSVSAPPMAPSRQEEAQFIPPAPGLELLPGGPSGVALASIRYQNPGAATALGPLSPPCFLQKLKSQEVAEGSPIRLECRVRGNPQPLVR